MGARGRGVTTSARPARLPRRARGRALVPRGHRPAAAAALRGGGRTAALLPSCLQAKRGTLAASSLMGSSQSTRAPLQSACRRLPAPRPPRQGRRGRSCAVKRSWGSMVGGQTPPLAHFEVDHVHAPPPAALRPLSRRRDRHPRLAAPRLAELAAPELPADASRRAARGGARGAGGAAACVGQNDARAPPARCRSWQQRHAAQWGCCRPTINQIGFFLPMILLWLIGPTLAFS